ncbi:hypothetical protein [Pectinatus haikarae]|uniref:Uncharacterized protein n=1 Tax=Pectinatus haikarae TaxID=349096 RepID=A0ABT9Y8L5_9FIRM|nr:hypothetical protein [Pectinatus haikarae]MDQ0204084.1 hypothetical protein [Pectinatus haikarae]
MKQGLAIKNVGRSIDSNPYRQAAAMRRKLTSDEFKRKMLPRLPIAYKSFIQAKFERCE